jgi:nitrogen fixation NifU-like protein
LRGGCGFATLYCRMSNTIDEAIRDPKNLGEMTGADAVGTAGSGDCGDMLRMWIKFRDEGGRRVIDKATFQSFGCQTAIAVASMATELIKGKTPQEAMEMSGEDLSAPLGPLPPMKIHCAQLVEGALKNALTGGEASPAAPVAPSAPVLADSLQPKGSVKITFR